MCFIVGQKVSIRLNRSAYVASYGRPTDMTILSTPAPDCKSSIVRHARKGSEWRGRMFFRICMRDGVFCAQCRARAFRFWYKQGNGRTPEGWSFSWVYQRSNLEVDHIVPLSEGGTNDLENLWLLCTTCHKKKTSQERSVRLKRLFAEWREVQEQ